MPILENGRWELFAQALAKGESATKAYESAGYRGSRSNAARLRANEHIAARILEIQGAGAKSAEITVASLLDELEHARQRADSLGQLSASVRAISEKARLAGLVVERQEIAVVNTEPEPQSTTEVLAEVMEKVGERAARALAEAFGLEFDQAAIAALYDGPNVPIRAPGISERLIEKRRPTNVRKRPVS